MIYHLTYHLRAPYSVYLTENQTIRRRPCGALPTEGRIVRFLSIFRHSTVPGEVSVRYVTTQVLKNRPVSRWLSKLMVICKLLKSYGVGDICDHIIMDFEWYTFLFFHHSHVVCLKYLHFNFIDICKSHWYMFKFN